MPNDFQPYILIIGAVVLVVIVLLVVGWFSIKRRPPE